MEAGEHVVYFDETSCNLWMKRRMAWSSKLRPVKVPINKVRGHGVTVIGAIGHSLPKGVFSLARSTNQVDV